MFVQAQINKADNGYIVQVTDLDVLSKQPEQKVFVAGGLAEVITILQKGKPDAKLKVVS